MHFIFCLVTFLIASVHCQGPGSFGGLISKSTVVPCVSIDLDGNGPTLECNNATVLVFGLRPGESGGGVSYTFQNQNQAIQGPGKNFDFAEGTVDENDCLQDRPNVCQMAAAGTGLRITLRISRPLGTFNLDWTGINGPFAYEYKNCISPIQTPQTDDMTDKCGQRSETGDRRNYAPCPGNTRSDLRNNNQYFGLDETRGPYYTQCAADCAKDIDYIRDKFGISCWDQRSYVKEKYLNGNLGTQGDKFVGPDGPYDPTSSSSGFTDFPVPTLMCPCQMTQTRVGRDLFAPIYNCKSGSCAGTCGTALPCRNNNSNICANTAQPTRCIKCQPDKSPTEFLDESTCIYNDIDRRLFCNNEGYTPFCPNAGDSVVGPGTIGQSSGVPVIGQDFFFERDFIARQCNCDAYWVDRAYWMAPMCTAYRINQPEIPEYTVTAEIENLATGDITELQVGVGKSTDGEQLPRATGNDDLYLALVNDDKPAGNLFTELHGQIVICDGKQIVPDDNPEIISSCSSIRGSGIRTSPSLDGRANPWDQLPNNGSGKVPLPQYVQPDPAKRDKDNAPWWYYIGPQREGTLGRNCNEWGWAPNGLGDTIGGNILCGNLQGTCVPGFDQVTGGDITVTPSYVAQQWANYVKRQNETASTGAGVTEVPRFVPPGWTPSNPNIWVHDGKVFYEDPTLFNALNVRVLTAVNAELAAAWTTNGGGHLEPFVEDQQSTGDSAQNCLLQPEFGYGTLWVKIVNDAQQTAVYTLVVECTPGIEAISQDGEYNVEPGESSGLPVAINLLVTTAVFIDPTDSLCNITLRPVSFPNRVLDTYIANCTFSKIFSEIGPIGSGLFENVTSGGFIGNLSGPVVTDFCQLFPAWCDLFGGGVGASTLLQTFIMILALVGILILISFCASKMGQVFVSESILNLKKAKVYKKYATEVIPEQLASGRTKEEIAADANKDLKEKERLLEEASGNAFFDELKSTASDINPKQLAPKISKNTAIALSSMYSPGAGIAAKAAYPEDDKEEKEK